MLIDTLEKADTDIFLELAGKERWVVDPWEPDFLLKVFPQGCFCVRDSRGRAYGFVTSFRHRSSGWIGNLIVDAELRGRGIGRQLFQAACQALQREGVETVWLTASESGRPLYEQQGFSSIDRIQRWSRTGRGRGTEFTGSGFSAINACLDRLGWGDERHRLLHKVFRRGITRAEADAFAVLQPYGDALQLGPCAALNSGDAARMIEQLLDAAPAGKLVYCDAPERNSAASRQLESAGFSVCGSNQLMFSGQVPDYRPEFIYALATMGSCG